MKERFYLWLGISWFVYIIIRIIEYATGQNGTPEWAIDFFPIVMPFIFFFLDKILIKQSLEKQVGEDE